MSHLDVMAREDVNEGEKASRTVSMCSCSCAVCLLFVLLQRVGAVTTSRNTRRHPALSACAACVELNSRLDVLLC